VSCRRLGANRWTHWHYFVRSRESARPHIAPHPGSVRAGNCRCRGVSAEARGPIPCVERLGTPSPHADFWRSRGSFRISAVARPAGAPGARRVRAGVAWSAPPPVLFGAGLAQRGEAEVRQPDLHAASRQPSMDRSAGANTSRRRSCANTRVRGLSSGDFVARGVVRATGSDLANGLPPRRHSATRLLQWWPLALPRVREAAGIIGFPLTSRMSMIAGSPDRTGHSGHPVQDWAGTARAARSHRAVRASDPRASRRFRPKPARSATHAAAPVLAWPSLGRRR